MRATGENSGQSDTDKIMKLINKASKNQYFKKGYKAGKIPMDLFYENLRVIFNGEKPVLSERLKEEKTNAIAKAIAKQQKAEQLLHTFQLLRRR